MRILLSADMEGISATSTSVDVELGTPEWAEARALWVREINAVISGLIDGGSTEVVVTDAHGSGANLDRGAIDERAALIRGRTRRFGMLEGIEDEIKGVVFLGYHGGPGSGGVLSHSFVAAGLHSFRVNGRPASEGTINALLAASFGAPVILVSGDDVTCEEAEVYAPDAEKVMVKRHQSRFCARLEPPGRVIEALREAAERASRRLLAGEMSVAAAPQTTSVELEFASEATSLAVSGIPGVQEVDARTVRYESEDVRSLFRCLSVVWTVARASRDDRYG